MVTALHPGDMLPVRRLSSPYGGPPVAIGGNRPRAQVLVVTHAEPCERCAHYLESFEPVAESLRTEKAEVLALVGSAWEEYVSVLPVRLAIAGPAILDALAPEKRPVVAVVDRFGQLFSRSDAGDEHRFPEHDEILARLLDINIRCPECGVPDVPSPDLLPEEGASSGGMRLGQ